MPGEEEEDKIKSEEDILNKKFMDLFHKYSLAGKGGFGSCSIVIHYDSGLRLIEKISLTHKIKKESQMKYLENEGSILDACKHKYVTKFIKTFKYGKDYYLYMEMADKGDLQKYLDQVVKINTGKTHYWKESKILKIFVQLVQGLQNIHKCNVIHRDIKGKNTLLFSNGVVKICDFGVAKVGDEGQTKIGDGRFMANSVIEKESYSKEVDVYSLGVLLHYMIYLEHFHIDTTNLRDIKTKDIEELKKPKWISDDLFEIMKSMLIKSDRKRITLEKILNKGIIKDAIKKQNSKEKTQNERKGCSAETFKNVFNNYNKLKKYF